MPTPSPEMAGFESLLRKLEETQGADFTRYRPRCIQRRVRTRLRACACKNCLDYLAYLRRHPDEYELLLNALTINVTEFFRNPEAFRTLEKKVLLPMSTQRLLKGHHTFRIWSAGCSSGEEPYSLAILVSEALGGDSRFRVRVDATDIDRERLAEAVRGEYSRESFVQVSRKVLNRYFDPVAEGHRVSRDLHAMVRFREHDMARDPPLRHMDLVVCRNVFIYFNRDLQELILSRFCQALKPGGHLMLGKTESLSLAAQRNFETVSRRERIYRRRAGRTVTPT